MFDSRCDLSVHFISLTDARLAQSVERKTLNLVVVGSSPTVGIIAKRLSFQLSLNRKASPVWVAERLRRDVKAVIYS